MRARREKRDRSFAGIPREASRGATTAATAVSGAVAGAAVGMFAGPIGAVVGGAIGATAGAAAGVVVAEQEEVERVADERRDAEIGVIGGNIGAAPPNQPPPRVGTYAAASAGGHTTPGRETPDAGPIPSTREG